MVSIEPNSENASVQETRKSYSYGGNVYDYAFMAMVAAYNLYSANAADLISEIEDNNRRIQYLREQKQAIRNAQNGGAGYNHNDWPYPPPDDWRPGMGAPGADGSYNSSNPPEDFTHYEYDYGSGYGSSTPPSGISVTGANNNGNPGNGNNGNSNVNTYTPPQAHDDAVEALNLKSDWSTWTDTEWNNYFQYLQDNGGGTTNHAENLRNNGVTTFNIEGQELTLHASHNGTGWVISMEGGELEERLDFFNGEELEVPFIAVPLDSTGGDTTLIFTADGNIYEVPSDIATEEHMNALLGAPPSSSSNTQNPGANPNAPLGSAENPYQSEQAALDALASKSDGEWVYYEQDGKSKRMMKVGYHDGYGNNPGTNNNRNIEGNHDLIITQEHLGSGRWGHTTARTKLSDGTLTSPQNITSDNAFDINGHEFKVEIDADGNVKKAEFNDDFFWFDDGWEDDWGTILNSSASGTVVPADPGGVTDDGPSSISSTDDVQAILDAGGTVDFWVNGEYYQLRKDNETGNYEAYRRDGSEWVLIDPEVQFGPNDSNALDGFIQIGEIDNGVPGITGDDRLYITVNDQGEAEFYKGSKDAQTEDELTPFPESSTDSSGNLIPGSPTDSARYKQLAGYLEGLDDQISSLSSHNQIDLIKLQKIINDMNLVITLLSNLLKAEKDTKEGIVRNI